MWTTPPETQCSCSDRKQTPPFFASAGKEAMPPARQFRQGRSREPPLRLKDVDATTRNPMFLFRLSGLFLLRYAQRALSAGLFHEPPRNTRAPLSLPQIGRAACRERV